MSSPLDHGAISRALGHIAFSIDKAVEEHKVERDALKLAEVEQQIQVALSGEAGTCPAWQEIDVFFAETFVPAASRSGQRDNPYEEPQFTWGFRWLSGVIPVVACAVTEWITTDDELIQGARLAVGAFNPCATATTDPGDTITTFAATDTTTDSNRFAGSLHLSFQGFAVPVDDDDGGEAT
jgi:hypothetical protein